MSDLRDQSRDQDAPPNLRSGPGNRLGRDRSRRLSDLVLLLCALVAGCAHPTVPATREEVHRPEVWVDAFSAAGGDGSSAHPLKAIPQQLLDGVTLHLRSGLYAGPFVLGPGTRLAGTGEVVLTGEAGQTVVTATDATLEGISVQGGSIGLEAGAGVVLSRVHFSGQRAQAALVHGTLKISEAVFEASVEGIDGVVVERGATLEASTVKFSGGFKRAVVGEQATLTLDKLTGEGVKTLLNATGGASALTDVRASRGSGPALFFSGGTVTLTGAEITGHEYAVLVYRGAAARISGLRARGALQACVSAIDSKLELSGASLVDCGAGGAVMLQQGETTLRKVEINAAHELGVFVKGGTLKLEGVSIAKVSSAPDESLGDALHVRAEAVVTGEGELLFSDLGGSGVFVSSFAKVTLPSLTIERAHVSALFAERDAVLVIETLLVRGGTGPALVVTERATAQVGALLVAGGNEPPVYADCQAGAKVTLGRLESTVSQVPSRCVTVLAKPKK